MAVYQVHSGFCHVVLDFCSWFFFFFFFYTYLGVLRRQVHEKCTHEIILRLLNRDFKSSMTIDGIQGGAIIAEVDSRSS